VCPGRPGARRQAARHFKGLSRHKPVVSARAGQTASRPGLYARHSLLIPRCPWPHPTAALRSVTANPRPMKTDHISNAALGGSPDRGMASATDQRLNSQDPHPW